MRILREAGLIRGERQRHEMRNTSRYVEVDARYSPEDKIHALVFSFLVSGRIAALRTASSFPVERGRNSLILLKAFVGSWLCSASDP